MTTIDMTSVLAPLWTAAYGLIILAVIAGLLRSPIVKGWFGEAQGALAKHLLLNKDIYSSLNNITIPTSNGTTQIDHVVVSKYGIFVIETKNMKGWIFGDEKSREWTQNLYGRKFRFQNPLHQNYRHIRALAEFLKLDDTNFHSVVMFWGDAQFKTPMPDNVMTSGYTSYIKSKQKVLFSDDDVRSIVSVIQSGALPKTWATRTAHVESLKARHSSTTTCPKCSSELVLRTAKSGANAGKQFYGCSKFPACRYMRNV
ncbi:MAG TPA: NERD domain-containing protein [Aromatoleum sp.]|uniref:nuclease-related domain-containing protein n=1 Tax=Aromatoleum sp. TaxID=2307007 RepID=UPI002B486803|nr:NERD domain-containing protein [Aromatoleum sp.]HJV25644.1 NERD domain-containing protein [Aromatoleum sp.]